jgi:hypothetical protein
VVLHQLVQVLVLVAVAVGQQRLAVMAQARLLVMVAQVIQHQFQVVQWFMVAVAVVHLMLAVQEVVVLVVGVQAVQFLFLRLLVQQIVVQVVAVRVTHRVTLRVLAVQVL